MHYLNLGILAHVDAGKTTLTERLLYAAGVIDEIGSVDDGSTQTDFLPLERQRGITIKSAVVSFVLGSPNGALTVNLIDTPGHPDFIAEVERVLNVLDGAVLVISAVEGVQSQTRVIMRTLQRLRIPTLIFVNKIDRAGAQHEALLDAIAERLTPSIISMGTPRILGSRDATFTRFSDTDPAFVRSRTELLAQHDEALLSAYVADPATVSQCRLHDALASQTGQALVHPVYFGSASTGAGVEALTAGVTELLTASRGDVEGPVSGTVFKIDRGPAGERVAYVRMFSGTVRVRDRVQVNEGCERKITAVHVFEDGTAVQAASVVAGQICKLNGLADVKIGDAIGAPKANAEQRYFAPPTLETVVTPRRIADKGALRVALDQLAEQDPLINVRQDDVRQEIYVSLYGEVQKEVIQETLASDFKIDVGFCETTTICIERPAGSGHAVEVMGERGNPFLATIGLHIDQAPVDSGIEFRRADEVFGSMPVAYFKAVEDTVRDTLQQGLCGWQVTDCTVTMTQAGYMGKHGLGHQYFNKSMSSTGADFRGLTPLVVMSALKRAGTTVYSPIHHFRLEVPVDALGAISSALARLEAAPQTTETRGSSCVIEGEIPAARVHELQMQLSPLTRGEGALESSFDSYQPMPGAPPQRRRTDNNPLDRKEYLLHVTRRV